MQLVRYCIGVYAAACTVAHRWVAKWPLPPHCLFLLHGMLLQQCYLVHLHGACAGIATVKPAAAAFPESADIAVSLLYSASYVSATELVDCKAVLTGQTLSLQQASGFICHACCNCFEQTVCISTQSASQAFMVPLPRSTLFKQWCLCGWTAMVVPSMVLLLLTGPWYHPGKDVLT